MIQIKYQRLVPGVEEIDVEKIANMTRRALLQRIAQVGGFAGASMLLAGCNIGNRKATVMKPVAPAATQVLTTPTTTARTVANVNAVTPAIATSGKLNQFGMNTWFLGDWDGSFAFVDAMKHARSWNTSNMQSLATTDQNGWPTEDAGTVVYTGMPEHINGTYKLVFNGQGNIAGVYSGFSLAVADQQYDASTNTTTADLTVAITRTTGASFGFAITQSKRTPSSPVGSGFTNVRLYRPGYPTDGSVVFTDYYVQAMQIGSVIRTMDWTNTNSNTLVNWSDRNTPLTFYKPIPAYVAKSNGQDLGGTNMAAKPNPTIVSMVALEHHIQLANATGCDLWINVPVIANDDFITKMAQAILYGTDGTIPYTSPQSNPVYPPLDSNLNVYVEFGNEVWNSAVGFYCFYVVMDLIKYLPADHPVYAVQPQNNIYYTGYRYTAYMASHISDLFRAVFGDSAMMTRVRPVLMGQKGTGNEGVLSWLDAYGATLNPPREVNSYVYGAGGSGYYGVNTMGDTPGAYFIPNNYPDSKTVAAFPIDAMAAKNYGLQRIAYEGGDGVDNIPTADILAINADPRMETMTEFMHNYWSENGGDLLVYYTMTGAVDWEFTPDITNLDTPKYNALLALKGQPRAAVNIGQALPGEMLVTALPSIQNSSSYLHAFSFGEGIGGIKPGQWMSFPGNSAQPFAAQLSINAIAQSDSVIALWVNGVNMGNVTMPADNNLAWSPSIAANIPQGLVMVRLQMVSGGIALRSIDVKSA